LRSSTAARQADALDGPFKPRAPPIAKRPLVDDTGAIGEVLDRRRR
jgi:hypothetical protein